MNDLPIYPIARPRRLRRNQALRALVRETNLDPADLIYPLFVRPGKEIRQPISSMPGQYQWSIDKVALEVKNIASLGIRAVMLFGIPEKKDAEGSDNFNPEGIIPLAFRKIKDAVPDLIVISDMCFCEYTDHGHCGIINTPSTKHFNPKMQKGYLLNDPTLEILGRASIAHAEAGADIIAPSGMIDGMVAGIRAALDSAQFHQVAVMSYAAKYASAFYGPFREAAESPPSFGNRKQYQMDPPNSREAMKEVDIDVREGADILMVKPAMPYLDVLSSVRSRFDLPIAAYQVSGEYAMLHAASSQGWIDLQKAALESLMSIKRAGADMIITYFAKNAAQWIS